MLEDEGHRECPGAGAARPSRRSRPGPALAERRGGRGRLPGRTRILGLAILAACLAGGCRDPREGAAPTAPAAPPTTVQESPVAASPRQGPFLGSREADPIDWRPWSEDLFAPGQEGSRPVMVVLGYAGCLDCRARLDAWAKEPGLASLVDRLVVPVLVDRDERPDVDASLMRAVHLLSGTAGWPAVVLLDSAARPFAAWSWGAVRGEERPLRRLLEDLERRSLGGAAQILEKALRVAEKLDEKAAVDTSGEIPAASEVLGAALAAARASFDAKHATFGEPPLFPRAPLLGLLLHLGLERGDAEALAMVEASLAGLASGPMRDREDGGFFRFAREPGWKVVSPEKPLADNAALVAPMLAAASREGAAEGLREAAAGLVAFVERGTRDLLDSAGGVAPREGADPDRRVFADTLALAVSALALASRTLEAGLRPALLATALEGAGLLDTRLRRDGFVLHCIRPPAGACEDGYLDDQVFAATAFLDVDEALAASGRPDAEGRWLRAAREVADAFPSRFGHEGTGGYFFSGGQAAPSLRRIEPVFDGARPCGNSAAATLFLRLASRTGEPAYRRRADAVFAAYAEVLAFHPLAMPSMVAALDRRSSTAPAATLPGPSR